MGGADSGEDCCSVGGALFCRDNFYLMSAAKQF